MLGALTHQALSLWWPPGKGFDGRHSLSVYRLAVRVVLDDLKFNTANGIFELKEHFVALGLGLLPAYWYYWRRQQSRRRNRAGRAAGVTPPAAVLAALWRAQGGR